MSVFHTRIGAGGTVRVGNRQVFIREGGNGEPTILLPDAFLSNRAWLRLAPLLQDRKHTIAVDLIGVGRSSRPRAPRDMAYSAQAETLAALLDALQIERAHLIGAGYGGGVALSFAGMYPTRAQSIVAIETPILTTNHDWIHQVRSGLSVLRLRRPAFWGIVKSGLLARQWTRELLGKRRQTAPDDKKHTVFECYYDPYADFRGWWSALRAPIDDPIRPFSAITVPILYLQGAESPLRAQLDRMHDQLLHVQPKLHWQMIPLAQHDMAIQLPALVADAINWFWGEVNAR